MTLLSDWFACLPVASCTRYLYSRKPGFDRLGFSVRCDDEHDVFDGLLTSWQQMVKSQDQDFSSRLPSQNGSLLVFFLLCLCSVGEKVRWDP